MSATLICPNCKAEISHGNVCEYCGTVVNIPPPKTGAMRQAPQPEQQEPEPDPAVVASLAKRLQEEVDILNKLLVNINARKANKRSMWYALVFETLGLWALIKRRP